MYDVIILGGGPGGYTATIRLAQYGKQVALIEKDQVGGVCLNRGCIPTKTLLHTANLLEQVRAAGPLGLVVDGARVDYDALRARKDAVTEQLRTGVEGLLKANGVTVIHARACVEGPGRVSVAGCGCSVEELEGAAVVVAAGSRPLIPAIPGTDLPGVYTSDGLLASVPQLERLVIIGGGVIGMEFATLYQALGTQVTVLEAQPRILPTLDRKLAQNLSMVLKRKGVTLVTGAMVEAIQSENDSLVCRAAVKGETLTVPADGVLLAIGRAANTDLLFAPSCTPQLEKGRIVVDEHRQTSIPGLYAIGDIAAGSVQLAHAASAQALALAAHLAGQPCGLDPDLVPSCVYTEPEIASVGLTEAEAKSAGISVTCGKFLMTANGRNLAAGGDRGYLKLVCDQQGVVKGAQLFCAHATDLVGECALAIARGLTVEELADLVRPHPTFEEAIGEAAEAVLGRSIHSMPAKRR